VSVSTTTRPVATRRERAGRVVEAAARGGLIGTVVALAAWLIAGALAASAFVLLVVVSLAAAAVLVWRGSMPNWIWLGLAIAWVVVLLERAVVQENGGVWVALAGWIGVVVASRRAGISKLALPLLAYPLVSVVIVLLAGEDLADPWGSSWLWILAVLGPVIGARTIVRPSAPKPAAAP
jgi:hypothetical protein